MSEPQNQTKKLSRTFLTIWGGQLVSLIGSGLTQFALGVWVYEQTGSVTTYSILSLFIAVPAIIFSPFAGVVADRFNRRMVMIMSDTGTAVSTLTVLFLLWTDRLEIWHIYLAVGVSAILQVFQRPAYTAAIPQLVQKEQLEQANGFVQIALAVSQLIAPVLAGVLIVNIGLSGVIAVDLTTFLIAILTLLLIRIPDIQQQEQKEEASVWQNVLEGWRYLQKRTGLLALIFLFTIVNFFGGAIAVLVTPLVLTFADASALGIALSIGGSGMLFGSIALSVYGGRVKNRIAVILGSLLLCGIFVALAGSRPSIILLTIAAFGFYFNLPVLNGLVTTLLQNKTEKIVQGRVFATQDMLVTAATPIGILLAGPLADRVFEPMFLEGGALYNSVGAIIGTGDGRGIGFMFILSGFMLALLAVCGASWPTLYKLDKQLPDIVDVQ